MKIQRGSIVAACAVALLLGGCAQATEAPERNDDGEITSAMDNADILKITVGDCFNMKSGTGSVDRAAVVPCDDPHSAEAFASFDTADADKYPGSEALVKAANEACLKEFESFVGTDYNESKLEYWPIYPSSQSWADDDRETLCVVANPGKDTKGSLADAKI